MDKRVFDYVKKMFLNYFPEKCVVMTNEDINSVVVDVCKELKVYDRSQILEFKVDDLILDMLYNIGRKNRNKLWNDTINFESYVSKFVIDNKMSNFSEEVTEYIIKKIVTDLMPFYSQAKLNKRYFDNNIKVLFEKYKEKLFSDIYKEIYKFINNMDVIPIGVRNDTIAKDITVYFVKKGRYNVLEEIKDGKHNSFIMEYVSKISNGIEQKRHDILVREERKIDSVQYIYKYIVENLDIERKLSREELLECTSFINSRLSVPTKNRDRGLTPEEIVSPMYVSEIVRYYNRYMMKQNSTERNNVPKKIKPKKKRRFLQRSISTLLLIASLAGAFGTGAVVLDKGLEEYQKYSKVMIEEFSDAVFRGVIK